LNANGFFFFFESHPVYDQTQGSSVDTLTPALPSTNIPRNTDPLHCTSMIGSHSRSAAMAFKGEGTFGTLGANNPFLSSLRADGTIATNCPMVMSAF
jgi:hypothetical protein